MSEKKGLLPIPSDEVYNTVLREAKFEDKEYLDAHSERLAALNPIVHGNLAWLCDKYVKQKDTVSVVAAANAGISTYRLLELEAQRTFKKLPLVGPCVNEVIRRSCQEKTGYVDRTLKRLKEDNPPIYRRLEMIIKEIRQYGNDPAAAACAAVVLVYTSLELQAESEKLRKEVIG